MNSTLTKEASNEATPTPDTATGAQRAPTSEPLPVALHVGSTPGSISLVPAHRMVTSPLVKRGYQWSPKRYESAQAIGGRFEIVSPILTPICETDSIAKAELLVAALNAYDPKGGCTL